MDPCTFSGDIAEGKVWGRGASDTKCSVMAFFQAVEELLAEGFVPPTDVYLASSCTEEWGGDGAPKIVAELQRRGLNCSWYVMRAVVSSRSPSVESTVILPWWEYLKRQGGCEIYRKEQRRPCQHTGKGNPYRQIVGIRQ